METYDILFCITGAVLFYMYYLMHKTEKKCIETFNTMIETQKLVIKRTDEINHVIGTIHNFHQKIQKAINESEQKRNN